MKKVLIVDDEPLILYALSVVLRNDRAEVKTVTTGKEALREIVHNSYDVCFLDIRLPDINGLEVMKAIREISPATRIVIMTGSEVNDEMMKSIREGAHLFLPKPFDLLHVKALMKGRGEEAENAFKDHESFVRRLVSVSDRRKHERKLTSKTTTYATLSPDGTVWEKNLNAHIIDMSIAGIGIRTGYPLEPGQVLRLDAAAERSTGIVRWSTPDGTDGMYKAGIQFM